MKTINNRLESKAEYTYSNPVKTAYQWCMEGDDAKKHKDYYAAIVSYHKAFELIDPERAKYLIAKVTSCYRRINRPQSAVDFYMKALNRFGKIAVDHVVLTSVSGAYGDLKKWDKALECANYACELNEGVITDYLEAVMGRISYNSKAH